MAALEVWNGKRTTMPVSHLSRSLLFVASSVIKSLRVTILPVACETRSDYGVAGIVGRGILMSPAAQQVT